MNADTQAALHHPTIWDFLKRELKLYPEKLQMHHEIDYLDQQKRILIAICFRSELRNNTEFFKRIVSSDEAIFSLSGFVNKQNCSISARSAKIKFIDCQKRSLCYVLECNTLKK